MMPSLRIRQPFAGTRDVVAKLNVSVNSQLTALAYHNSCICCAATCIRIPRTVNSKDSAATFYWILEIPRRRLIHLTLIVCTAGLAIGSEVVQAALPNDRLFDPYDIAANVVGSGLALGICSVYHKRMLERKRKNKHYDIVPGDEGDLGDDPERDVELGVGITGQETGVIQPPVQPRPQAATDVTEELDNWDENEEDWDAETPGDVGQHKTAGATSAEAGMQKRED
nr:uncharacterized protein c11e3.10 [Quercus suber]